jgi:acetyl coenzyme A synthetase (ADP forming)-like protein
VSGAPDGGIDVLLADGTTAHVRTIRPDDAEGLLGFHARLSPESVMLRFFGPHPRLSDAEVVRFTHVDGIDRLALVAERATGIVAVARYDRTPGSDEAEVAFVVDDEFQGRGLGTILLEHLASAARSRGIRRFVADTLSENFRMLHVFRDAGFARQFTRASEVMRVVLDIAPSPEARLAIDERDRQSVVRSMSRLLRPTSIAVVGASRDEGTIGHQLVANLLAGGFQGPVYPVNPKASYVASIPAWPGVEEVPGPVDLAVVAVPAEAVPAVVEACGRKGVGALVIISAGFAEVGADGAQRQGTLVRLAHAQGMRLVGPNCFGVVNTEPAVSMNATFAPSPPVMGPIGFASQSGGLGIAILAEATARGLGLSSFVSMGNKADVSGNDALLWWEQDPATEVVLLYLESFGNPRRFSRIAERLSRTKPIVAVKSGRSAPGRRGASSHTAALAGADEAVDALFRRTGVIRADTIEELFDVAGVLALQPLPRGRRVAIVGNAGGPGVLAADACAGHGLTVPELSPSVQEALRSFLPVGAAVSNPVDLIASATADDYRRAIGLLARSNEVDAILVIFTPPLVTRAGDVADAVAEAADAAGGASAPADGTADGASGHTVTVVASFLGTAEARQALHGARRPVPCFTYPETAARALARVAEYAEWRARPPGVEPVLDGLDPNAARRVIEDCTASATGAGETGADTWITGAAAMRLLAAYGIPVTPTVAVAGARRAAEAAGTVGLPVALKASGPGVVHKTDVGGVALGLASRRAVHEAYDAMAARLGTAMDGAVVQPMVPPGVESIAGFVQDPAFGPLVLFGLGGTAVELLGDHSTRLAPLTDADARDLVHSLRGSALLTGYRGSTAVDVDALVELLLRLGRLAEDLPEVAEADLNPVIATPAGVTVVDARLRVTATPVRADDRRHLA